MKMSQLTAMSGVSQSVTSTDGTTISYQTVGSGPAVIVVPGCMSTAASFTAFASTLAENFTVHTIERRGRGRSGPQGDAYGMPKEREDLAAVRAETGARHIFGHSFGGLITLEAARNSHEFEKIAVYEPGVSVDGLIAMGWMPEYRRNLDEGRALDAFVEFCIAIGPEATQTTPRWMMKLAMFVIMSPARRRELLRLVPANLLEHQEVQRHDNTCENYREVTTPTLLMHGGKSGLPWVPAAIEALTRVLPVSQQAFFPKLNHFGPDQKDPAGVARAVAAFFRD
jgi:pimeloyl-ACP methyl ester carboxylesterase